MQTGTFTIDQAPIFCGLGTDDLELIRQRMQTASFQPGDAIAVMGEVSPGLHIIRSGVAQVVLPLPGGAGERVLASHGPGECVGEISVMTGEPPSATVRAVSETETWMLSAEDFGELVELVPGLWRNLSRILSQRLVRTNRRLHTRLAPRTVAIVAACGDAGAVVSLALASSIACQTGKRVLLAVAETSTLDALRRVAPEMETSPVGDLVQRMAPAAGTNKPEASARYAGLTAGAEAVTEGYLLGAIEGLQPHYDFVLVFFSRPQSTPWWTLFDRCETVVALASDDRQSEEAKWVEHAAGSPGLAGKLAVVVVSRHAGRYGREPGAFGLARHVPIDDEALLGAIRGEPSPSTRAAPAARREVDSLARRVAGLQIGVALGAGAAKGFAHIGVLRVLEERGVPIDFVVGASIGAVVGAMYAGNFSFARIAATIQGADRKLVRWTLPLRSLWRDSGLRRLIREPAPDERFEALTIPFAAVATDLASGTEVMIRRGVVWRAVHASVSIPGIFPPVTLAGRHLVDGGVVSPVPARAARRMGANLVIAVDLSTGSEGEQAPHGAAGLGRIAAARGTTLVDVLWRSTEIMQEEITARGAATADLTIQPHVGRSRWSDFSERGKVFIEAGAEAARQALPELERLCATFGLVLPAQGRAGG